MNADDILKEVARRRAGDEYIVFHEHEVRAMLGAAKRLRFCCFTAFLSGDLRFIIETLNEALEEAEGYTDEQENCYGV